MADRTLIPCHIVCGPLGVGKTSAILNYLRHCAPRQRVGVLVNDFGPVGLDSTTLEADAPMATVLNVPGGCICCTMLEELPECIRRLVSEQTLDRLIIEPSGMASPVQVIALLQEAERELNIRLQPAIVILSTVDFDEEKFERLAYYHRFSDAADILVFNRCDQAGESKIKRAQEWAGNLDPPKLRVLTTSHGELPLEIFELTEQATHTRESLAHHHHDHSHDSTVHSGGFVLDAARSFDKEVLLINLSRICLTGIAENQVLRLKGVFHTHAGWQTIEIANRMVTSRPSAHRRDNRMEWLTQPGVVDQTRMLMEIDRPVGFAGDRRGLRGSDR